MSYSIAAIDIHKKVLTVVVATVAGEIKDPVGQALKFECARFGTGVADRAQLVSWLQECGVQEIVIAYASHCTSVGR